MTEHTIVHLSDCNIYQQDNLVLQHVNLNITKGEFVYLIGKTGSGKSSLLKTLYAALPLNQGKGTVAGHDLKSLSRRSIPLLRRKLGIVFQDFNLLDDRSVEANLVFALRAMGWTDMAKMKARINELLERVDLKGKTIKCPTPFRVGATAGGHCTGLAQSPQLIIADEPTGNLDPETSDEVLLLLRKLAQENDTAVLFATHDYRILENFPARIVRCHNGKVFDEEDVVV
ncbi:MAG: ATP-binding cassette domain-containing protein [Saprospiraceae bacterium]|nr:ATP-binding cassette domain-containing protein [Saprospiraceae bacterium]